MTQSVVEFSEALAEAVKAAAAYTVMVEGRRRRAASGVACAKDLVLTASHVVEIEEEIPLTLPDGSKASGRLAGRDPARDLALLRLSGARLARAATAGAEPSVGQLALSVARTPFDGINATFGIVSAAGTNLSLWRGSSIEKYIQSDAPRYPGFSGGPVADVSGAMLAINVFGHRFGTELAIPWRLAFDVASRILSQGSIKRAYLGVRSQPVEIPSSARGSVGGRQTGLLLVGVEAEGPAEKAGLMVGDILVGIGGKAVADHKELLSALDSGSIGEEHAVEVLRGGDLTTLKVVIGSTL